MANQNNQQPFFGIESFVDSDDLMSWLLLNPEVDFEAAAQMQQQSSSSSMPPLAPWNVATDFFTPQQGIQGQQPGGGGYDFPPRDAFVSSLSSQPPAIFNQDSWNNGFGSAINQTLLKIETAPPRNKSNGNLTQSSSMQDLASVATNSSPRNSKRPNASASGPAKPKKRPRESLEDLEARVNSLKAENADLHAHLLNVTQRTTEVFKQRSAMERLMISKLAELGDNPDSDQSELAQIVKQYTDIYADYGKCRQREVEFHLQQLEKLIVPTKTTKMCLWTINQDKSFKKSPMYEILQKELEVTPEQIDKIQERREKVTMLLGQLRECLELLNKLRHAIAKKHESYDAVCGRVQEAASPKQTVQFLMWINKNADILARYIPGFNRSQHYVPNHQFVEKHLRKSNSSKSLNGMARSTSNSTLMSLGQGHGSS